MCCFQGLSAVLIFLGVWIVTAYAKFDHLSDGLVSSLVPAYVLLAVGIVLFALGTIGCVSVVRDHKCLFGLVNFRICTFIYIIHRMKTGLVSCPILSIGRDAENVSYSQSVVLSLMKD